MCNDNTVCSASDLSGPDVVEKCIIYYYYAYDMMGGMAEATVFGIFGIFSDILAALDEMTSYFCSSMFIFYVFETISAPGSYCYHHQYCLREKYIITHTHVHCAVSERHKAPDERIVILFCVNIL